MALLNKVELFSFHLFFSELAIDEDIVFDLGLDAEECISYFLSGLIRVEVRQEQISIVSIGQHKLICEESFVLLIIINCHDNRF